MNFDFLKDLRGLGYVYENCCNAEKLAVAMPVQSVFTSRKSAELLAKFLYMAAHNQEMENLLIRSSIIQERIKALTYSKEIETGNMIITIFPSRYCVQLNEHTLCQSKVIC